MEERQLRMERRRMAPNEIYCYQYLKKIVVSELFHFSPFIDDETLRDTHSTWFTVDSIIFETTFLVIESNLGH